MVEAERALSPDEWMDRLLVAQELDPGVYRHYVLHGLGCLTTSGGECNCLLVSVFSGHRRIVVVDHQFNTLPLTLQ